MNKKAYIWGAGGTGQRVYSMIKDKYLVLGYVDSDSSKWGDKRGDLIIYPIDILSNTSQYDCVILGTLMGIDEVPLRFAEICGTGKELISDYVFLSVNARIKFLERFAESIYDQSIPGMVAECGVYRGEFAKEINRCFFDRKCLLFDTFSGFDERDFCAETEKSLIDAKHLIDTTEEYVLSKMPNRKNVETYKGYFPETVKKLDGRFCFVNLDMDLYNPTIEGLRWFYPRMVTGGVILIHDYFSEVYPNIKMAVNHFERECGFTLKSIPIGDDISLAVII